MQKVLIFSCLAITIVSNPAYAEEDAWTGAYVGVHAGVNAANTDFKDNWCWAACDAPTVDFNKPEIGVTIGQNALIDDNFLVGIEADFGSGGGRSITTPRTSYGAIDESFEWRSKFSWTSSLRLRAGLAEQKTLLYVTGGFAAADASFREVSLNANTWSTHSPSYGASWNGILTGYTYGAGVEHQFKNFSVKGEFLRSTYSKRNVCFQDNDGSNAGQCWSIGTGPEAILGISSNVTSLRIGVNYHF